MKKILMLFPVVLMLSGCAWLRPDPIIKYETIEVKIPIYMKPTPPAVLTMPLKFDLSVFISPTSEGASSALSVQGEKELKRLLLNLHDRERAWRTWAE